MKWLCGWLLVSLVAASAMGTSTTDRAREQYALLMRRAEGERCRERFQAYLAGFRSREAGFGLTDSVLPASQPVLAIAPLDLGSLTFSPEASSDAAVPTIPLFSEDSSALARRILLETIWENGDGMPPADAAYFAPLYLPDGGSNGSNWSALMPIGSLAAAHPKETEPERAAGEDTQRPSETKKNAEYEIPTDVILHPHGKWAIIY